MSQSLEQRVNQLSDQLGESLHRQAEMKRDIAILKREVAVLQRRVDESPGGTDGDEGDTALRTVLKPWS